PIAASETSERILVVLNSSVADADSIVNDLGDNVDVLRLEAGTDALDIINDYLDEHADTKYSAIHLVSHGSEGYITLNGEKIDSTTINPADWKAIGEHLTDDADILVYGCDTAKSEEGKALVQTIANLTGADVAASIDSTGANGDWDLEYRSGLIEAATIQPAYSGRLASEITITIDGVDDFTELQTAIADVEAGGTIKFAIDPAFAANKDTDGNAENGNEAFGIDVTAALTIDKSITINGDVDGDGDADVILDANQKTYFFKVSGSDIDFTINGLILQNSKFSTKDTSGGAINISGTGVTFNFVNSTVTGSTNVRHGAAIFVSGTGAELNITDSVFGNNKSTWTGAAIYVGAVDSVELNVVRSVFTNNTIGGSTQKSDGGTINLSSVKNAKVWIKDSEFKNNTGTGVGGAAFGYYNASAESFAEITITGTDFSGNKANSGGAIRLSGKFTAVIDDCTFTGNSATAFGGAIAYAGKNSSIEVTNSTFTQNAANGTSTSYHGGGAIAFTNIDSGSSTEDIYLANNTFTENTSATHGGAISVRKMYINKNSAWAGSAGVFNLEITGSEFTKNASEATGDSLNGGGAIFFSADNSTLLISNSEFTENTSQSSAGAVLAYVNKTIMSNNVFRNNSAVRNGGALIISRGSPSSRQLHVENSLFDGNHAGYSGGAIFAGINANAASGGNAISTSVVNSTFINNSAYQAGGALYYKNNAASKVNYVVNSTFLGNSVTLADANYKNSGGSDCTSGGGAIHAGVGNRSGLQQNTAIRVNVINSILLDNTADGVASDLYAQSKDRIYAYYSIYNKATNVNITTGSNTTITSGDLFDLSAIKKSETTIVTETVTDPETGVESTVEKEVTTTYYVTNKDNSIAMKELVEGSDIYNAVNRTDLEVGSYVSGNTILYNYRVKNANGEWNSWSSDVISVDQNSDIRLLYYTAGATQYNPALMWSEEDGIVTATWTTIADAKAQLESGDGEYYFSPKAQDFGDVAVNGSLILHGFMPDSELKINLVLDSATDMVTVTGMKYTGGATISAGNMTIENALLMGEGNFTVTGGVFTAVNTTVSGFSGTITVDAANGIGQIVDSTLYDNSGTITGNGKLNILNSLVFGTENLSGYTAKFSVFDIAGTDAFNTYSAKADDVFGTELVWEDLTLTSLTASASSTAPHVNGAYAAVDGANLYYSTDRVNWKNFADDSVAAVNDASVIKTDGQGNIRIVMDGKATAGAYSSLMESAGLNVTIATDVVDDYDGYISLREAVLYAQNGEVAMNFDSNGDGTVDTYRITFDAAAIAGNTDDGYTMRPNEDGKIYIDLMVSTEGYSSALVFGKSETFVIDGENQNIVLDISQGTAGRVMEHSGGSVTIKNLALYGTGAADKQSTIASGGLVYLTNGRTFTAENVEFAYSRISSDGANSGAVFSNNGTLIINNSIFHHNNAVIASTTASTTIKVTGGRIYDNTASQNLIQGWNGSMTYLTNVEIDHNKTGKDKHIIYYERSADFYLDQVNVHDNTGGSNASAFLCVGTGQSNVVAKITNSAFYDNAFGRLIWFGSAGGSGVSFTLADSTIYNNTFNGVDDNRYIIAIAGNSTETYSVNVYNNTIAGNTSTQNVLYALQFSTNNDVSLLNNIILDNHGTADTGSMSVRIIGSGANVDAYGNIYETASVASTAVLNGKTMTAVSTDLGNHNTLSTVADVFGTEDLSTVWDGKTLAISADGAAADSGVLVGKIGSSYYVMQDGKWYAAATQAYYADFALDAAAGYGLGSTATVYTTAQNTVADGENQVPADRLYSLNNGGSEMIQVGAYALQIVSTEETLPVIVVPGLTVSTTYGDAVLSLSETQKEVTVKIGDENVTLYLDITWKAADGIALDGTQNAGIYKNVFTIDTITVYDTLGTDVTAQYKISSFVSSSFEVAKKAITVNANRAAKNYGVAEDPALSYRVYGLVGSDTLSGELARVAGEEVGTYEIQIGTLGADNTNYEITFNSANFTIRPEGTVAPVITLDSSYTYKGNNVYGQAIDLVDDKIAYTIQVDGTDVNLYLDVEWMAAAGIATDGTQNAGTVENGLSVVYVTAYADDGNGGYTDVSDQYDFVYDGILADLVVKKATVTVSGITAESKEYNGLTDAVLNYDGVTFNGLVNGDNLTVTATGAFADANADTGKTVNLSGLTLGGDSLANYELAAEGQQTTASADITAKTITVKADDIVIKEGETAPALTYTVEEGGLVGEDKLTGALEREAGTGVGTYQINQGTLGVADTNYLIEFTPGIFKIEPANPQIFITVDAYAATNTYGEALSLTETGKEVKIMVEGEEKTFYLDIVWKTDGTVAEDGTQNAGTYEDVITIHSVTVFEKDGENYKDVTDLCTLTLPAEAADLVIGKASLTVTADAKSMTVGGTEPELTYTVDGLKNGDAFSGTLVRAEGTAAGVYAITLADGYTITNGGTDVSANYDFSFVGANLSIKEAASLTVTTLDDVVDATDGKISFREAWLAAYNKTSSLAVDGVYTITFDQSLTANYDSDGDTTADSYRIALDSTLGTLANPNSDINLVIDGSIGTNRVILDGQHMLIMDLKAGTYTIQDMVFTGGYKSGSGGAMMANTTKSITLRNVLFTGNTGTNGGGAIYMNRGTVNIYDSEFIGNTGTAGAALYQVTGTLNVYNSVFTGNSGTTASVYSARSGASVVNFVNSVLYGNNSGPVFAVADNNATVNATFIDSIIADNGDANDNQINLNKATSTVTLINTVVLKGADQTADSIASVGTLNLYYSVTDADYSATDNFSVTGGINNATFADTLEVVDGLPRVIATSAAGKNGVLVGKDSTGAFYVFGKNATGDAANWISVKDSNTKIAFDINAAGFGLGEGATTFMNDDMKLVMVEAVKAKADPAFFAGTYRSPDAITLVVNDASDTANTSLTTTTLREALAFCTTVGTKYNIVFANGVNNEVNLFENGDVTIYMSSGKGYSLSGKVNVTIDGSGDGKDTDADGTNNKVILDGRKNSSVATTNSGNKAQRYRIIHAGNADLTLKNMTMQYGYVYQDKLGGGAVYVKNGALTLENMYFTGNQTQNYNADVTHGGAIAVVNSTTVIKDTVFEANKATNKGAGAGALWVNGGTVTITDTKFIANTSAAAWSNGKSSGAVTFINANFTVTNVLFSKNTLADTWGNNGGGGIGIYTSTGTITNATFTENKVLEDGGSGSGGGAVYIHGGSVTVQNSTFTKNESATIATSDGYCGGGGAINVRSGTVTLLNSTFSENKATGAHASIGQGGAVSIQGGTVTVEDSLFDSNSSAASGGAIANRAKLTVKDSVFINNSAAYGGGAIHYRGGGDDARLNVYSSTFYGNSAARGGAIEFSTRMYNNADVTIRQVTIAGNTATQYGGGLLFYSPTSNGAYSYKMNVYNSLILGNTSGEEGSKVSDDYYEKLVHNTPKQLKGAIYNSVIGTATIVSTNFKVDSSTTQIASGSTDYGLIFNGKASADYTVRFNKNYGNGVVELYLPAQDILQIATTANPETDQLGNTRTPGENGKYLVGAMDKLFEVPSLIVNTTEDVVDEFDGLISLREAIAYQKADPTLGNTITFSDQIDWSLTDKTIVLTEGRLEGTASLAINGALFYNGTDQGIITIKVPVTYAEAKANNTLTVSDHRVFSFSGNQWNHVLLSNMIVKGGSIAAFSASWNNSGGAIYSECNITLTNVTVADSYAWMGGGIYAKQNLILQNSYIVNNTAKYQGGGIYITRSSSAVFGQPKFENSFIAGNTA
ncbi:MAG: DUF4347 domain-containing protein, partial [Lentisphaeria bacterium]|nr:DUF4347 domain-containing protein [Lentisphaeria bacterium]